MLALRNLSIQAKILSILGLLALLCGFLVWLGAQNLIEESSDTGTEAAKQSEAMRLSAIAMEHNTKVQQGWFESINQSGNATQRAGTLKEIKEEREGMDQNFTDLKPLLDGDDMPIYDKIHNAYESYSQAADKISGLLDGNNVDAAKNYIQGEVSTRYDNLDDLLNGFVENQKKDIDDGAAQSRVDAGRALWLLIGSAIGGIIVTGALSIWVLRSQVTGPINTMVGLMGRLAGGENRLDIGGADRADEIGSMARAVVVFRDAAVASATASAAKERADAAQTAVVGELTTNLRKLSEGDLTARIDADVATEYQDLKSNFNEATSGLRELIGAVGESAHTIQTGSGEIAQASEDLARRTESNAASLEETAASITQMDGRLRASATAASQTVERADQAIATVGGGRAVADEAVQAMGRVSESAKGIDSVIEGLDKIAFQTRVLAMNAAVEAGRAGDAGRGFAVVADLVSALAMRAEEEAKRARDQLTVTQTDIVTAVEAVQKVDGALADISGDVTQVHTLLATMAADNQAQSAAITEISAAISTMDQSTQQNAAMVEETSAAARNLASEVGNLSDQASRFKVVEGGSRRPTPAARKPAYTDPASYAGPTKPLPAAAIPALARTGSEDWNSF